MAVITISRQFGSGGDQIARLVCERLNYRYFDKRLMASVAAEIGLSEAELVDFSEDEYRMRGLLERLIGRSAARPVAEVRTWKEDLSGARQPEVRLLDGAQANALVQATILAVSKQGRVVIVGRGGQMALRSQAGVLHVRVEGPIDERARRVQEQSGVRLGEALELIFQRDSAARDYLRRFYKVEWNDPMLYHLVINTGLLDLEPAAEMVAQLVTFMEKSLSSLSTV